MASASKTISLNVTANTAKYVAELRKLGTHSEKQIGAAARKASATFQRAELENIKAAQKAARKIEAAHGKMSDSMEGVKFAAQGAGGKIGEMAGRAENFGRAFAKFGPVGGPVALATVGIAGLGIAALAMGAAVAKGALMANDAVVSLTRSAAETIEKFDEFKGTPLGFTEEQVARIERANDGLDGTSFLASKLGVELASNVAPTVERVSILVGALAIGAIDAFNSIADGTDVLQVGLDGVGRAIYNNMIWPFQKLAEHVRDVRSALGLNNDVLDSVIAGFESWNQTTAIGITRLEAYSGGAMQGYIDQATQAIRAVGDLAETEATRTEAIGKTANALEKQYAIESALLQLQKSATKTDNGADKAAAIAAQELAAAKLAAASATMEQANNEKHYQNALTATGNLFSDVAGMMKEGSREAAVAAKLAALVQATVSTYAAANAALAVPIVGPALAAATVGVGLANVAQIVSTPIPAHASGGIVGRDAPLYQPNGVGERLVTARAGERVSTPEQWDDLVSAVMSNQMTIVELREDNRPVTRSRIASRTSRRGVFQSRDRRTAA